MSWIKLPLDWLLYLPSEENFFKTIWPFTPFCSVGTITYSLCEIPGQKCFLQNEYTKNEANIIHKSNKTPPKDAHT